MSFAVEAQAQAAPASGAAQTSGGRADGRLLTVSEVAEILRINKSTVYRMAKQGRLRATRVGRQWRFRKSVLDGILDAD